MNFSLIKFRSFSQGTYGRSYDSCSVGNMAHQGGGSSSRILRFNRSNSNTTQNTYTMTDLDNLKCLTFSTITTPQQTKIKICQINLTKFYSELNISTNDNVTINLTPYNNTNYYELLSTTISGNTSINVSGNNSYIVLGVAEKQTVTNYGTIYLYDNAFLTNYFYYPQSTVVSINNYGQININSTNSIWYELTIKIPLNSQGIVNGSYTKTLPTSPSPPW